MASIAVERADRVVLTLDNPRTEDPARIFADAEPGFAAAPDRARRIDDRAEAVAWVLNEAGPADTIVICGKGHETYQILGTEKIPWDDRVVLLDAWREIGGAR
jgi:UDP-N-acetylmuramoyl-L-alanyl-D-glutamate--2,6-diaminopimelate ligase